MRIPSCAGISTALVNFKVVEIRSHLGARPDLTQAFDAANCVDSRQSGAIDSPRISASTALLDV